MKTGNLVVFLCVLCGKTQFGAGIDNTLSCTLCADRHFETDRRDLVQLLWV
jgi:hypothetical protein